jgi:hypothetical protein
MAVESISQPGRPFFSPLFCACRLQTAFKVISLLMVVAAALQLSLISKREWDSFFGRVDRLQKRASRSLSFSPMGAVNKSVSMPVVSSARCGKRPSADESDAASPAIEMFLIPDDAHLKYD